MRIAYCLHVLVVPTHAHIGTYKYEYDYYTRMQCMLASGTALRINFAYYSFQCNLCTPISVTQKRNNKYNYTTLLSDNTFTQDNVVAVAIVNGSHTIITTLHIRCKST